MNTGTAKKILLILLALFLAAPAGLVAQDNGLPAGTDRVYSQEELDRLLAPLALYPDALLSQILMASTYPLEVAEADQWVKGHPSLFGEKLNEALKDKPWDASVKSLCNFPRVLSAMSENLEETSSLGDAFLGQQDQVMDTIQNLRKKAREEGNLKSTAQQNVSEKDGDILIEPVKPDVLYAPAYDPCWVYGPWWYPTCPSPWFYPGFYLSGAYISGPSIWIGPWGHWSGFYWHRHRVYVDARKKPYSRKYRDSRRGGGREIWRHDSRHRKGFPYRSPAARKRFDRGSRPGTETRRDFRGFQPEGRRPPDSALERRSVSPPNRELVPKSWPQRVPTMPRPDIQTQPQRVPTMPRPDIQTRPQRVPTMPRPDIQTQPQRVPSMPRHDIQTRPQRVPTMPRPDIQTRPQRVPSMPRHDIQTQPQRVPTMPRPEIQTQPQRVPSMPRPETPTRPQRVPQIQPQRVPLDSGRGRPLSSERPRVGGDALQAPRRGMEIRPQGDGGWKGRSGTAIERPSRGFPGRGGGGRSGPQGGGGGGRSR